MKNLFIKISLLISFIVLLGSYAKADTISINLDTISNYEMLVYCSDDTLEIFVASYTNVDGWVPPTGNSYGTHNTIIITQNNFMYSNNSSTWNNFPTNTNGEWQVGIVWGVSIIFNIYFTDPAIEPWIETTQAICGSVDTLYAGDSNYQEGMRYVWKELGQTDTIADGFYPSDTSLIVDHTAYYILDIITGCGVVSDTIYMEIVTTNPPDLGVDTTFCGEEVYYVARLTETYGSYLWYDGSTADTLLITSPDKYFVTVNSACLTNEVDSVEVFQHYYLPLDLGPDQTVCGGGSATIALPMDYSTGPGYQTWYNATDSTDLMPGITQDTSYTLTESMEIFVLAKYGNCPQMLDYVNVTFTEPMEYTILCIATVDTNGQNKILWNPIYSAGIYSYNIYKKTGTTWNVIGNVLIDSVASWGQAIFYDEFTDPGTQAVEYAVSIIDTCGNESGLSASHKTIWNYTSEITGGTLLHRTNYEISDESFEVENYIVIIDSLSDGNLNQIDVFNENNLDYLITNPLPGATYYSGAVLPFPCSGSKSLTNITDLSGISISNPISITTVGIKSHENLNEAISIYPNPSSGLFHISSDSDIQHIQITNSLGQVILTTENTTIDLSSYNKGFYFVKIHTVLGQSVTKLLIQ